LLAVPDQQIFIPSLMLQGGNTVAATCDIVTRSNEFG